MIRVAVVSSDPGARRGLLQELSAFSETLESVAFEPADAAEALLGHRTDVVFLDVQSVDQIACGVLTKAMTQLHASGTFFSCCSGCPTDRDRIATIEGSGALWCSLPATGSDLIGLILKLCDPVGCAEIQSHFFEALNRLAAQTELANQRVHSRVRRTNIRQTDDDSRSQLRKTLFARITALLKQNVQTHREL